MLVAVILLAVISVVSGQSTPVTQCTHNSGDLPLNLYVEGCLEPPCQLPQLETAVMHAVFRAPHLITSMSTRATAFMTVGPITVPFPYPLGADGVTCNFLTNTYCPLIPNEIVQYKFEMYIQPSFPEGTNAGLELVVVDQNGSSIFCFRTTIQVLPPRSGTSRDDVNEVQVKESA